MKILLLSAFLFISTSFSTNQLTDETWIGTFDIYMTENSEFIIYYNGNYHECFAKYAIDRLYISCDSMNRATGLDTIFEINNIREVEQPKIKTKKI